MTDFLLQLKLRNEPLFYFGLLCLAAALLFLLMTKIYPIQVYHTNAWYKPLKFALSTCTFVWAMAWYIAYLPSTFNSQWYNWTVIVLLGLEILYIAIMAGRGLPSHYNNSTPLYAFLFSMMGLAATVVTIYTAYIGILFWRGDFPDIPKYYLWSIRLGIILFVIFSFEGFLMGARSSHTVGIVNDNSDIFILGWSKLGGDLRIAHFIGMHALQVLPLVSYYVFKNTKWSILLALLYGLLAFFTLHQALQGKSLLDKQSYTTPKNSNQ
jgi:hypothetical protein